ncbi:MAG: universal stress protein [Burkholderiales bacterium]|jgi:nucleotide-binding universal stress UspA family protein|nr:universal stress protein [Burkholderiales bacterium]
MTSFIKQVLVHLDPTPAARQRLQVALRLAQQQGARLSALYATMPLFLAASAPPDAAAAMAMLQEVDQEQRAATRNMFDEVVRTCGMAATWSDTLDLSMFRNFVHQALYADLLVLGQPSAGHDLAASVPADFPEYVLLASGRPALVLPHIGCPESPGTIAAIAWKPTREAARAVAAALPLLQRASQVHVLCWGAAEEAMVTGEQLELGRYLELHGVHSTWHRDASEPEALGEILLSRISDLDVDLLVMGCYGHSRAREWMLGGASRTILASMTVPVLMAH